MAKERRWLVLALMAGCSSAGEQSSSLGETDQPIIYGEDDRREFYQITDSKLRELARSSGVALILPEYLHRPNSGSVGIAAPTLQMTYGLCESEAFLSEPAAAVCSGVLIDHDLVLTAGHCVTSQAECESYAFVFDYLYRAQGELENISSSDVYGCRRLVTTHSAEQGETDYAVVQLDRAPSGRTPVRLRRAALKRGEPLVTVGFPSGVPMKIDRGAQVKEVHGQAPNTFALNSDTFEGSSGSAIFDQSGELAGVLVLGGDDYVDAGTCSVSKVVPAEAGTPSWGWEQATYPENAVKDLCKQRYPSKALCNLVPRCGDGYCSSDPVDRGCFQDCAEGKCANGLCEKDAADPASPGKPVSTNVASSSSGCSAEGRREAAGSWWLVGLSSCVALVRRRRARGSAP